VSDSEVKLWPMIYIGRSAPYPSARFSTCALGYMNTFYISHRNVQNLINPNLQFTPLADVLSLNELLRQRKTVTSLEDLSLWNSKNLDLVVAAGAVGNVVIPEISKPSFRDSFSLLLSFHIDLCRKCVLLCVTKPRPLPFSITQIDHSSSLLPSRDSVMNPNSLEGKFILWIHISVEAGVRW
jgi:hypothetical protein